VIGIIGKCAIYLLFFIVNYARKIEDVKNGIADNRTHTRQAREKKNWEKLSPEEKHEERETVS
jgi:hypothetical protein